MTKILELEVVETQKRQEGIRYPEILENYDERICPYYFNKDCEPFLNDVLEELGESEVYEKNLKYCPTNFDECLAYNCIKNLKLI